MAVSRGQPPVPSTAPRAGEGGKPPSHRSIPAADGASGAVASLSPRSPFKGAIVCPLRLLATASRGANCMEQWQNRPAAPDAQLQQQAWLAGLERWGEGGFLQRCVILPWLGECSRVRNAGGEVSPAPGAAERLIGEIQSPEYVTAWRLLSLFYYSLCYTS